MKSVSAFEMYRKKHHRINYKDVIEFLVFDEMFPRSTNYCVRVALKSMDVIVQGMNETPTAALELQKLKRFISEANIESITSGGLHEFVDTFQLNLNVVGNEIYKSFIEIK